jgi:hypothetical protein
MHLVDEKFEIRVADFGSTRATSAQLSLTAGIGTPKCMAPELAESSGELR